MTELHDAAAAYALDALDPAELEEYEAHLAGCATCRREVGELADAAAELAFLVDAPAPPPTLRASVLAGIADVEQLPALPGRPRRALVMVEPDEPEPEPDTAPDATRTDPVRDELALRRASRRTRLLTLLVAAVTVVALALGGVVWSLARQGQAPPAASPQLPQVDPSLLAAPDAKIYATTLTSGAQVSFVVSKRRNQAAFVGADLPSPGAGNVYQLWTLKGNTVVRGDQPLAGGASTQSFSGPIDDSDALAVNIEPAGSSPQAPTTPVLGAVNI